MKKFLKKDCEKIYISKEHYKTLSFLIEEHFSELNRKSLKSKEYEFDYIAKIWFEDYINKLFERWQENN